MANSQKLLPTQWFQNYDGRVDGCETNKIYMRLSDRDVHIVKSQILSSE